MPQTPWRGILVATALPFTDGNEVDYDAYAAHVAWLIDNGSHGVAPNGSLGEYQTLTREERGRVVETAVAVAKPLGGVVMSGCAAYGADESLRWAEQAAEAGADAVLLLPPNTYRAPREAVVAHYRTVAQAGLPIMAYNNPFDTKVDLLPDLLAELYHEGLIKAVKEFTGDVRRFYEIKELAPELDISIGTDDVTFELGVAGAVGWIAGYNNAFPHSLRQLYDASLAGDLARGLVLYRDMHPLLRWDSRTEFVQAIKLSMDIVGRRGGACRHPRVPLSPDQERAVRVATEAAIAKGYR
jgi:1-pyrroline-4-hydroxy-2-carboxylate deaminase